MHIMEQESIAHGTVTIVSSQKACISTKPREDVIRIDRRRGLVALLDAVGGRGNWRGAAEEAAQAIHIGWKDANLAQEASTEERLSILIERADVRVASLIVPEGQRPPGMTVVLAAFFSNQMAYAHVGDSRIYLSRDDQLRRLTEDDGYFLFAVQKGWLSQEDSVRIEQAMDASSLAEEELKHFHLRNKITCAVGWSDFQVHTGAISLLDGDRLLFCTDGIHDNLTDLEIEAVLKKGPMATSARRLVYTAHRRSHQQGHLRAKPDDISAVVAGYQATPDTNLSNA
jgi:PPM family protein phosphatase